MDDGYGFGAEGDWKAAALTRATKVMAAGLEGGTSFMEDYTYHLTEQDDQLPGGPHAGDLPLDRREKTLAARFIRWGSAAKRIRCGWCSTRRPDRP